MGLRFALVLPVVEPTPDRVGQRRRHVDEDVELPVLATGFEDEHPVARIGAQPIRKRTPCAAATDDHIVPFSVTHHRPS